MRIGVTGGIGSGKSLVVKTMASLGAEIYYADLRAKELVLSNPIKSKIIELFGEESYLEDGSYHSKWIANIVFQDRARLELLNSIIHPAVFEDFDLFCIQHKDQIIVYESALMIETGHTHLFDIVILVTAPEHIRIQRVMYRDGLSEEQVRKRILNQWSDERKIPFANYVIENINKIETIERVNSIWYQLMKDNKSK